MSKRLIVCCDGTWNTPDQPSPTNVAKIRNALRAVTMVDGVQQVAKYVEGVGTRPWEKSIGGMFGFGLSANVEEGYRFLIEHFTPAADNPDGQDDQIFLFGFSRGAFTARSLGGLIRNSGLLRRDEAGRVGQAYELYRDRTDATHPNSARAKAFRAAYSYEPRIRFIGVWDTVGALGIPADRFKLFGLINRRWSFHDTQLSRSVDNAFHAISIDERRGPFRPTLWIQNAEPGDQVVEQVWFAGAHSDVGGGESDPSLSELPLHWMVGRAEACGLVFDGAYFQLREPSTPPVVDAPRRTGNWIAPDPTAPLHDSYTGVWKVLGAYARHPGTETGIADDGATEVGARQSLSSAVPPRVADDPSYPTPELRSYLAAPPPITAW